MRAGIRIMLVGVAVAVLAIGLPLPGPAGHAFAAAQEAATVTGAVESGETAGPLSGANVAVRSAADSSVVGGTLSNASGRFRIAGIDAGQYFVEVSYVGYATERSDVFTLGAGEVLDLPTFSMSVSAVSLESISVRTERAPASFAADRTIYSTEDMPMAAGGVATEVLQSVPELEVDIDGEVTLRGSAPEIYLNGRPAPMDGEALNVFLDQFPADRIERVEVIPNPSARFNAEGSGGIVNIVLKEDVDIGLSGSVFANGSSRGEAGGGGRIAYQRGDWLFSGGGYLRHSDRDRSSYDLRQNLLADPTTYLRQDAWSSNGGLSGSVDLTVERELGDRALLWTEGRLHNWGSDSEGVTTTAHMDAVMDTTQLYDRVSASGSDRLSFDIATGLDYSWEPQRHELEVELEVEYGRDSEEERVETFLEELEAGADPIEAALTVEDQSENESETTLQLDYVRALGEEGRIEVGYRGEIEDRRDDRRLEEFDALDGSDAPEVTLDGFDYRQVFNSLYITALQRWGDFGVQLGVRGELADTRFSLPTGESFENDYHSFFPSANISYELGGGKQVRLSYSRRIRRPNPRVMNPIDRSTDPLNRRVGNPDIDPQYTQSVSLDASWTASFGTLRLSPYYRITENDWAEIKTVDEEGVSTVTWENVATQERYGASVTASARPLEGWSGFISFSANREVRDASNLAPEYSGSSFRWSARANLSARLTSSLSAQGMVSYSPARDVPQGRISSRTMTHFGVRQQLLGDRASIRVAVVDPFDLFNSSFETHDPTHVQVGSSSFSMRSVRISLSYAFGDQDRNRDRDAGMEEDPEPESGIR